MSLWNLKGLRRLGSDVVSGKGVVVKIICYSQSFLHWLLGDCGKEPLLRDGHYEEVRRNTISVWDKD